MAWEAAKCPLCGEDIQLPKERERAFCACCGGALDTQAAIELHDTDTYGVHVAQARFECTAEEPALTLGKDNLYRRLVSRCRKKNRLGIDTEDLYTLSEMDALIEKEGLQRFSPDTLFGKDFAALTREDQFALIDEAARNWVRGSYEGFNRSNIASTCNALFLHHYALCAQGKYRDENALLLARCAEALCEPVLAHPKSGRFGHRIDRDIVQECARKLGQPQE